MAQGLNNPWRFGILLAVLMLVSRSVDGEAPADRLDFTLLVSAETRNDTELEQEKLDILRELLAVRRVRDLN